MDHHENIYIKMMVDKAYQNKTSRKTESKKIDPKKKKIVRTPSPIKALIQN